MDKLLTMRRAAWCEGKLLPGSKALRNLTKAAVQAQSWFFVFDEEGQK